MKQLFTTPTCGRCDVLKKHIGAEGIADVEIIDITTTEGVVERAWTETVHIQSVPYLVADGKVYTDLTEIMGKLT
jgi:glutaredoxin